MRIGELATAAGVSVRSLRHYEQSGLIHSERADNGYRRYGSGAVNRVHNIRHLLDAGLTVDDVRVFLPCLDGDLSSAVPSAEGLQVALDRLAVLERRIAAQSEVRDRLASALRTAGVTGVVSDAVTDVVPDAVTDRVKSRVTDGVTA
ncbi:MerR family transcriptional regulator [Kitasatospora sp. NPDC056138]|uniref:MerR family transcriptional regulator n=1 Tax=Kitasatospora sp. NPDC056138 TaxID=3345724 RepID=UPI0035DC23B0